jgi:hypothetical protein
LASLSVRINCLPVCVSGSTDRKKKNCCMYMYASRPD